jgi:hypothetical protein
MSSHTSRLRYWQNASLTLWEADSWLRAQAPSRTRQMGESCHGKPADDCKLFAPRA